jgi:hypothetical protein
MSFHRLFREQAPTFYREYLEPLERDGVLLDSEMVSNVPKVLNDNLARYGAPHVSVNDHPAESARRLEAWAVEARRGRAGI